MIFSMIMVPKLSEEQRQLIESMQGRPIEVCDDRTQRIYVLVDRDEFRQLTDNHFRRELQVGFDQADAGDMAAWSVEQMLQEARRRQSKPVA